MKDIQQLIKKNSQEGRYEDIFPKTFTDAVKDKESGKSLIDILSSFNMYFLSYNGSREQTRLQVPMSIRKTGLWVTYVLYDKTVVTEWYAGEAIDDNSWGDSSNWRVGTNMLVGDISISSDGYWVINGVVTTTKAQGKQGITPMLRVRNNHLQVSYTNGSSWIDVLEFTNSLHIKGYAATVATLPSSAVQGDIYGVGPTYDPSDTGHTNPIYQLYVKDSTGWVNNGKFTSIAAGVVQTTGTSTTEVMSQDAVSKEFASVETDLSETNGKITELGSKIDTILSGTSHINLLGESFINYKTLDNWGQVIDSDNGRQYVAEDIKLEKYIGKKIYIGADWNYSGRIVYAIVSQSGSLITRASIVNNIETDEIPNNADVLRIAVLAKVIASTNTDIQNSQKSIFVKYKEETDSYENVKDNASLSKSILDGIEDGSIYPDGSIDADKTNMFIIKQSSNLLDLSKIKENYNLSTSDIEYSHESYFYLTDYIAVNESDVISLQYTDTDNERKKAILRFCTAYDADKNCLNTDGAVSVMDYQVPSSVKYIRFTAYKSVLDKYLSLVKTSDIIPYEEYGNKYELKEELISNVYEKLRSTEEEIKGLKGDYESLRPLIINMMCIGDSLTQGSYYGTTDGHSAGKAIAENYPYYIGRLNNWNVRNMGVSGYSAIDWWNSYKNPSSATIDVQEKFENVNFVEHDFYILWLGSNTRVYLGSGQTITYTDSTTGEQVTITSGEKNYQVVWNRKNNLCRLYDSSAQKYLENGWSYAKGYIEDPRGNRYVGIINDMTDSLEYDVIGKDNYEEYGSQEYGASATACYCKIISKIIADNYKAKIVLGTVFFGDQETNDYINNVIRNISLLYPDNVLGVVDNDIELFHDPINHIPPTNGHFNKIGNLRLAKHWGDEILKLIDENILSFEHILIGS